MHASFSITRSPGASSAARSALASALTGFSSTLRDEVLLVASELVTNVVIHTPTGRVRAVLWTDARFVHLDVSDEVPDRLEFCAQPPPAGSPAGRGLFVAQALATKIEQVVHAGGKTITVRFAIARRGDG